MKKIMAIDIKSGKQKAIKEIMVYCKKNLKKVPKISPTISR